MGSNAAVWTTSEDQVIRTMYPMNGASVTAKGLPNRTVAAVYRRAEILGVKRMFAPPPPRNQSRRARVCLEPLPDVPAQSVEDWKAKGGVIEVLPIHAGRPFVHIKPEAARPSMPVRGIA